MARSMCAVICAAALICPSGDAAQQPKGTTIKERVVLTPAGSLVEVRLKDKRKLAGRMGPVTDTGFVMQHVSAGKVEEETVAFQDVKSFKQREHGMSTGTKVTLGILAGVGITFLVLIAIAAAHGFD